MKGILGNQEGLILSTPLREEQRRLNRLHPRCLGQRHARLSRGRRSLERLLHSARLYLTLAQSLDGSDS